MRSALTALVMLMVGIAGCAKFTSGQPVVQYQKGKQALLQEAPMTGTYALYSTFDSDPKVTVNLEQGDELGFRTSETGRITAVAGDREFDLPDASYVWKRKP